jgi:hypothetical protein
MFIEAPPLSGWLDVLFMGVFAHTQPDLGTCTPRHGGKHSAHPCVR